MEHPDRELLNSIPIIVLGVQDAGEILTLQRAAYLSEAIAHNDFALPPLVQTLSELQTELEQVTGLGIRSAGRLIGSVRLRRSGDVVELGRLIVAPDLQGHGIGTRLLVEADNAAREASEIRLFTGEHSEANIRLYRRHGYQETARTSVGAYDLVHFVKMVVSL